MKSFNLLKRIREKRSKEIATYVNYEYYNVLSPRSSYDMAESYRKLYANIVYLPIESKCRKIAVASAIPGEGKTTVSVNLAITLAQNLNSAKILLIDSNLRKPGIELMLPKDYKHRGLSEFLSGKDEKPNIVSSSVEGLYVLYSGNLSIDSTRLISSEKMADLFSYCEDKFDYIIMDTPSMRIGSEALLVKKHVNGYILVAKSKRSDVDSLGAAIDSLRTLGAKIFGVVMTGEPVKRKKKRRIFRASK